MNEEVIFRRVPFKEANKYDRLFKSEGWTLVSRKYMPGTKEIALKYKKMSHLQS